MHTYAFSSSYKQHIAENSNSIIAVLMCLKWRHSVLRLSKDARSEYCTLYWEPQAVYFNKLPRESPRCHSNITIPCSTHFVRPLVPLKNNVFSVTAPKKQLQISKLSVSQLVFPQPSSGQEVIAMNFNTIIRYHPNRHIHKNLLLWNDLSLFLQFSLILLLLRKASLAKYVTLGCGYKSKLCFMFPFCPTWQ